MPVDGTLPRVSRRGTWETFILLFSWFYAAAAFSAGGALSSDSLIMFRNRSLLSLPTKADVAD